MDIRKNPWLKDANRKSLVSVRITSLNLHGTGRRRGFVRPTEIFTTMFKMEVRLGRRAAADPAAGHIWTQARTFDEFREFYDRLTTTGGTNAKEKLTVPFPVGKDGEADVFILLERKDEMEALIQDVVANLDMLLYRPLYVFLGAEAGLGDYLDALVGVQALVRAYIRRQSVLKELCHKYEDEQSELFHILSGANGIPMVAIPPAAHSRGQAGPPLTFRRRVLWLEVNKTSYALSLLCLASVKRFRAAKANRNWLRTDYHPDKYCVLPLCDIAEVRRGPCSRAFRTFPGQSLVDPGLCLVVVASCGTMNMQTVARSGVERDWLLDSLAMMANNSLSHTEARLRGRKWRRYHNVKTLLPVPSNKTKLTVGRLREAVKMKKLLLDVIDVEEEVCEFRGLAAADMAVPVCIEERVLWFDEGSRRLLLSDDPHAREERAASRGLDIDDIAEIRPGRTSFDVDGNDTEPILCIIGSETVIRLPMDTVKKRNKLIGYFQSFTGMYRNHEFACSDQWAPLIQDEAEEGRHSGVSSAGSTAAMELAPVPELQPPISEAVVLEAAKPTPPSQCVAETAQIPARRVRTCSSDAVRRGSHTLAECVDEIQSQIDGGREPPAASNDSEQTVEPPVDVPPEPALRPPLRGRGESWSGIVTDTLSQSDTQNITEPTCVARAESMSVLPDKPRRNILQRAGHKVAKRLSFVATRAIKRGSAPASLLSAGIDGHSVLGDTIPEEPEEEDGDALRIEPQARRKSLAARVLQRHH